MRTSERVDDLCLSRHASCSPAMTCLFPILIRYLRLVIRELVHASVSPPSHASDVLEAPPALREALHARLPLEPTEKWALGRCVCHTAP